MSPEHFVQAIHADLERSIAYYESCIAGESELDPGWTLIKEFYRGLSEEQRLSVCRSVRGIQSDSICRVLSLLDNQTYPAVQI